jgi:ABC-type tungstate transport system permease subunit
MPAHRYTILQISIICFLVAVLGVRLVSQYPDWFNGAGRNLNGAQNTDRFITLGSATSTEDSGFLDYVLPIFRRATGLDVHVQAVGTGRALAIGAEGAADALLVPASRGDSGGTYRMELRLWKLAGIEPDGHTWYRSLDQSVGQFLNGSVTHNIILMAG